VESLKDEKRESELLMRKALRAAGAKGFRWQGYAFELIRPDIYFPRSKIAIFVKGCLWYGHAECGTFALPSKKPNYWIKKVFSNKENLEKDTAILRLQGWIVEPIWECELKNLEKAEELEAYCQHLVKRARSRLAAKRVDPTFQ
jgi:DNA mismatch endonuclease (patch repair protein)